MRRALFILSSLLLVSPARGQYAPQAGVPGSTAIISSSSLFTGWANHATIQRGYMQIDNPSLGYAYYGSDANVLGYPDLSALSLGDSGVVDLTFPGYIYNGPGADFAVFENGFINPTNDSQAFMELAFVEVSSDGINYTRFPAHSATQTSVQVRGSGDYLYANQIHNLAGKYRGGYGTPFDLDELPDAAHLDKNLITHVRLIDVIGTVGSRASHDADGNVINDPFPTNFQTGGFDLDAVGVIHRLADAGVNNFVGGATVKTYPNPVADELNIDIAGAQNGLTATLSSVTGVVMQSAISLQSNNAISLKNFSSGLYYLIIQDSSGSKWVEKIIKE